MSQKFEQGCVDPSSTTTAATALDNSLLGMSGFRVEPLHVAQQSRRDKLRVQPIPAPTIPDHLLVPHRVAAPDLVQVRDVYDAALFSSTAMLDFSAQEASSFANPSTSTFHDASNGIYKSLGTQPSCDWITSCVGGGGVASIQSPLYPSHLYQLKPGISGYHDVRSRELPGQENQKLFGDSHFSSPPFCHNALQEVVASCSPTVAHQGMEMASLVQQNIRDAHQPWVDGGSELLLLPSYGNQANTPRLESTAVWLSRQPQQWKGDEGLGATTQGLSLSLSSNPLPELQVAQFEERFGHEDFAARSDIIQGLQSSQVNDAGISGSHLKFTGNRGHGNTIQSVGGSSMDARRGMGPLGPFTGYATILKSSKFLRPAQQLLDEFCSLVTGSKLAKQCDVPERSSGALTVTSDAVDAQPAENGFSGRGGNSGASSSSFYSLMDACGKGDASNKASQIHRPAFQQMKTKLLYMQEEVCRRYKQYHQQMQMVVSSFESVAGLSAATPYTSLALKAVSKHFRCLKNAISDQLRHISKVLGEEFMSSPGSSRDTMTTLRLKFMDQSLQRQKTADTSSSFQDHMQPVWRPQRGLPERAVAVLRAWLFEHFLHPYPTDTDKHMLASQTGLSRNQVSNWFINARVRLWKPMVEEIHMLETKGLTEMDLNSASKNDTKPSNPPIGGGLRSSGQRSEGQCSKPSDCSSMGSVPNEESYRTNIEQWHREKRSRMDECMAPESMDGGLMSFAAYQGGVDIGGLGAVSLTLGLRHNEGANVAHQQQQIRYFGGQVVHDFVG